METRSQIDLEMKLWRLKNWVAENEVVPEHLRIPDEAVRILRREIQRLQILLDQKIDALNNV